MLLKYTEKNSMHHPETRNTQAISVVNPWVEGEGLTKHPAQYTGQSCNEELAGQEDSRPKGGKLLYDNHLTPCQSPQQNVYSF